MAKSTPRNTQRRPKRAEPETRRDDTQDVDESLAGDTVSGDLAGDDTTATARALDMDSSAGDLDTDETDDAGDAAERLAASEELDEETSEELGVDNIVGPLEAGVGGGLDEQEEARLGVTDEEIEQKAGEIARKARRR